MLRFFAWLAAAFIVSWAAPAAAREVVLSCHQETYVSYTDNAGATTYRWTPGEPYEVRVEMAADSRYPNAGSPQKVWTGVHGERLDQAHVDLDITLIENPDASVGYTNIMRLTVGSITAETTGVSYLRSALRIHNDGIGCTCTIVDR